MGGGGGANNNVGELHADAHASGNFPGLFFKARNVQQASASAMPFTGGAAEPNTALAAFATEAYKWSAVAVAMAFLAKGAQLVLGARGDERRLRVPLADASTSKTFGVAGWKRNMTVASITRQQTHDSNNEVVYAHTLLDVGDVVANLPPVPTNCGVVLEHERRGRVPPQVMHQAREAARSPTSTSPSSDPAESTVTASSKKQVRLPQLTSGSSTAKSRIAAEFEAEEHEAIKRETEEQEREAEEQEREAAQAAQREAEEAAEKAEGEEMERLEAAERLAAKERERLEREASEANKDVRISANEMDALEKRIQQLEARRVVRRAAYADAMAEPLMSSPPKPAQNNQVKLKLSRELAGLKEKGQLATAAIHDLTARIKALESVDVDPPASAPDVTAGRGDDISALMMAAALQPQEAPPAPSLPTLPPNVTNLEKVTKDMQEASAQAEVVAQRVTATGAVAEKLEETAAEEARAMAELMARVEKIEEVARRRHKGP